MSDTDLPVEGRDVKLLILLNGALQRVVDQVTSFSANAAYDRVETKPLGTSDRKLDDVLTGWEGSVELSVSRPAVDDLMDQIHTAQRNRTALEVQLREQVLYRDGSRRTYLYREVKLQVATTNTRAEARKTTLNWASGTNRIRV